jgi:cellulose synthase operon protein C
MANSKVTFRKKELRYAIIAIAAIAAAVLIGAVIIRSSNQNEAKLALGRAQAYIAKHDLRAARVELMNAVKADPKFAAAYVAQAEVALEMADGTTARSALEAAIKSGTPQSDVQHLLGHALWLEGDLERAELVLSDEEVKPKNRVYAQRILGRVLLDSGNISDARNAFDTALKIDPKNSMLWTDIAAFRLRLADQKTANEAADYAVSLDNTNIRALELRGRLVRSQYGLLAGLPWFEQGLNISPDDVPLLEEYAATLGELGRNQDMLVQARKILAIAPKNGRAYYMQAVIAARAGEYMLAKRVLSLAGAKTNETPAAMLVMAICEYQLSNYNLSADILERLLILQPNNLEARKLLARAKQSAGENHDALTAIRPLFTGGDADAYSAMIAARAFEATGDRIKAVGGLTDASIPAQRSAKTVAESASLRSAADAAQRNPGNARYALPYIRALMLAGQLDAALSQAKQLQANAPGVASAHMLVGDVENARGNYSSAAIAYQKSREIEFSEGIMLRLVDVYRRQKQHDKAREVLGAFTQFNPSSLSGQRMVAYVHLDDGQWQQAIPLLERLRKRVGYNDSILNANIARAYSGAGQHDQAIFNAKLAYQVDPSNPMVTLVYGQALLKAKQRPKAALELFQKANALMPGNSDVAAGLKAAKAAIKNPKP